MAASTLEPVLTPKITSSASQTPLRRNEKLPNFKLREAGDPLKILDPERKKLTSIESQRVMGVIEDTIKRLELSTILPFVVENLDRFSVRLGADLTNFLKEHNGLREQYQKAVWLLHLQQKHLENLHEKFTEQKKRQETEFVSSSKRRISFNTNKFANDVSYCDINSAEGKMKAELKQVNELKEKLQHSVRIILRHFVRGPTETFRNQTKERSEVANEILRQLCALKNALFERLLRTPSELKERERYLKFIHQREVKVRKHEAKLQEELRVATQDMENELQKHNETIRKLRLNIFNVEKKSRESNQRAMNESSKEQLAQQKNSNLKKLNLQQEIIEQKKLIDVSVTKHRESELALRKKRFKVETEVENWIQKYDTDMDERQDELDQLDEIYTKEKKQLNELEERFKAMETEYNDIMESRRIAREKAEEANRELQAMTKAATLIQSFWRAFKARKQLKRKKKKGKKGKKGAKKRRK